MRLSKYKIQLLFANEKSIKIIRKNQARHRWSNKDTDDFEVLENEIKHLNDLIYEDEKVDIEMLFMTIIRHGDYGKHAVTMAMSEVSDQLDSRVKWYNSP